LAVSRRLFLVVICAALFLPLSTPGHAQENQPTSKSAIPADVSGKWQVSWQGRLGTEQCTLQIQQDRANLTGTLQDQRGLSPLSGTVDDKQISFEVTFQGPRPFTTQFKGAVDGAKIEGTSQAVGVAGSGAYLGHAGEVVQPEHPWTAKRIATPPPQASN
jgi:hypothetical protein